MGPEHAAMAGHMYMTPLRSKQSGKSLKAKAVFAEVNETIERYYKDHRKALLDGYDIAHPKIKQHQYQFISQANIGRRDLHFDPAATHSALPQNSEAGIQLEGCDVNCQPDATKMR